MHLGYSKDSASTYNSFNEKAFIGDTALLAALTSTRLSGLHVLDFGCGSGRMVPTLLSLGAAHVTGIDPSASMIENADASTLKLSAEDAQKVEFACIEEAKLPYPAETFDCTIAHFVFHYLPDPVASFRELHRVLKSSGKLFATFNHFSFLPGAEKYKNATIPIVIGEKVRVDVYAREREVFIDTLTAAAFTISSTSPFDSSSAHIAKDFADREKIIFQNSIIVAQK